MKVETFFQQGMGLRRPSVRPPEFYGNWVLIDSVLDIESHLSPGNSKRLQACQWTSKTLHQSDSDCEDEFRVDLIHFILVSLFKPKSFVKPYRIQQWVSSAWSLFPRWRRASHNGQSIRAYINEVVTVVESVVLTLDRFCHTRLYLNKCVSRNRAKICVNDSDTKFCFLGCNRPPSNGKGFPSWSGKAENTELPRSFFDYSPAKKSINAHSVL